MKKFSIMVCLVFVFLGTPPATAKEFAVDFSCPHNPVWAQNAENNTRALMSQITNAPQTGGGGNAMQRALQGQNPTDMMAWVVFGGGMTLWAETQENMGLLSPLQKTAYRDMICLFRRVGSRAIGRGADYAGQENDIALMQTIFLGLGGDAAMNNLPPEWQTVLLPVRDVINNRAALDAILKQQNIDPNHVLRPLAENAQQAFAQMNGKLNDPVILSLIGFLPLWLQDWIFHFVKPESEPSATAPVQK